MIVKVDPLSTSPEKGPSPTRYERVELGLGIDFRCDIGSWGVPGGRCLRMADYVRGAGGHPGDDRRRGVPMLTSLYSIVAEIAPRFRLDLSRRPRHGCRRPYSAPASPCRRGSIPRPGVDAPRWARLTTPRRGE